VNWAKPWPSCKHQISGLTRKVDEIQANREARAAELATHRLEAAVWRADYLALARDFTEFKRRAEIRDQRWWAFAAVAFGAVLTALFYSLRKQP